MKKLLYFVLVSYFRLFARLKLKQAPHSTLIGITGSLGKSSTRLALVQILKTHARVKHTAHANSEIGISFDILNIAPTTLRALDWLRMIILAPVRIFSPSQPYDYYVVEMGIDSPYPPKNMSYLLSLITPHVGIVLNAHLTHAAAFDPLVKVKTPLARERRLINLIAQEKMKLLFALPPRGVAIYNADQAELTHAATHLSARVLTFGKTKSANLRILPNFRFRYLGSTYQLKTKDYFPPHFSYSFAASLSAGIALGIPLRLGIKALSSYRAPEGRMRLLPGILNSTIIDSSYNASPTSMYDALLVLKRLGKRHQKIAVIGDMRELGLATKTQHKNLAQWVRDNSDYALLFGQATNDFTLPLLQAKHFPGWHFKTMASLVAHLRQILSPGAFILVKGSQNDQFLERAVQAILQNPNDVSQLCRRGARWDRLRRLAP